MYILGAKSAGDLLQKEVQYDKTLSGYTLL